MLQEHLAILAAHDVAPFALSYDPVATLAGFAAAHGITYPLFADAGSRVIRALGILNTDLAPADEHYGIPRPGTYFIGADGRVEDKVFHDTHRTRDAAATALREHLGLVIETDGPQDRQEADTLVAVAALDSASFVRGERIGLRVTVALAPGVHVYGRPLAEGLIPVSLELDAPERVTTEPVAYPAPQPMRCGWLDEELPAYEGAFTLTTAVLLAEQREDVTITATLRFQACTDDECFIPQRLTFALPLHFRPFPTETRRGRG
jgi:hypothetical protein